MLFAMVMHLMVGFFMMSNLGIYGTEAKHHYYFSVKNVPNISYHHNKLRRGFVTML
jgi:hypothetical protein